MTLILTRSDVLRMLTYPEVVSAVRRAHVELAEGGAVLPAPPAMQLPGSTAAFVPMTAASTEAGLAVVKLLADVPANRERALPVQRSAVLAVSAETGAPEALLDGGAVTVFRTAAATAVATAALARPESRVLGLVGAGALAWAHVQALRAVRPDFARVVAWSRTERTARALRDTAAAAGIGIELAERPQEVVAAADVLCALTPSREPLIHGAWFRPGLHVNAVGAPPRADHREIDSAGVRRARVVVDSRATAALKAGDLLIPLAEGVIGAEHVAAELGEVLTGRAPGRTGPAEITLFKSVGVGLQDLATARLLIDRARERGLGTEIDLAG